jgi:hypothetical protein
MSYLERMEEAFKASAGKTVLKIDFPLTDGADEVHITFTDGSVLKIETSEWVSGATLEKEDG